MRCVVCCGGFARIGGVETFLHDLMFGLQVRGISSELLCWGADSGLLRDLKRFPLQVHRHPWRWGCRWGWPDRLLLCFFGDRLFRADVIVFGKTLDASVHRAISRQKNHYGSPRSILVTPYRPAEMWKLHDVDQDILNSFDMIVVQTESFAGDLLRLGFKGTVEVLPYIPPRAAQVVQWGATSPLRIGFLGRLAIQKNLDYLLDAFELTIQNGLVAELHIFGDGPERRRLKQRVNKSKGGGVYFHGAISRTGLPDAIDSCHLFAFSSVTEGQCLAALEILARGRPVVATRVGAFPEVLSCDVMGAVGPTGNVEQFAKILYSVAAQIKQGIITPEKVQAEYLRRFSREIISDGYARAIKRTGQADR